MIGFNAVLLNPSAGGIGTYMLNIIQEFNDMISDDILKIYLSTNQYTKYNNFSKFKAIKTPLLSDNPNQRVLLENLYWKGQLKEDGIDLFHSPISYIPYNLNVPAIVTIHDLRVFRFPETYTRLRALFLKQSIKYSVKKAKKIITISEFTKNELLDILDVSPDKIEVVHEGIDTALYEKTNINSTYGILGKYNISKPYIFTVGHLEPRKNYLRLIKAYESLPNEYKDEFNLVIGGKENFNFKSLYQYVSKNSLEDKVIFTGFIADKDLPVLYHNAELFIFPSIYEGFGFPPLESLASGVAVVASNATSMPEVLGNAAEYFDPYSIENIKESLKKVLGDNSRRDELLKNSKEILKRLTWENCARRTKDIYANVLEKHL